MTGNFVRLTANAGVLLCINGKKILVDALHNRYTEVFSSVPDDLLYEIAHGEGEFREIDLIVFTHDHRRFFQGKHHCAESAGGDARNQGDQAGMRAAHPRGRAIPGRCKLRI